MLFVFWKFNKIKKLTALQTYFICIYYRLYILYMLCVYVMHHIYLVLHFLHDSYGIHFFIYLEMVKKRHKPNKPDEENEVKHTWESSTHFIEWHSRNSQGLLLCKTGAWTDSRSLQEWKTSAPHFPMPYASLKRLLKEVYA